MKRIVIFCLSVLICFNVFAQEVKTNNQNLKGKEVYQDDTFGHRLKGVVVGSGYGLTSGGNISLGYCPWYQHQNKVLNTLAIRLEANRLGSFDTSTQWVDDIVQKRTSSSLDFSEGINSLHHESYGVLVDVYPFERVFRITGGVYHQITNLDGVIDLAGNVQIGEHFYPFPDGFSMHANLDYSKSIAMYLGFGMDLEIFKQTFLTTDLGFMKASYPEFTMSVYGPNAFYVAPEDLEVEERFVESKVKVLRYVPILRIGLQYKF